MIYCSKNLKDTRMSKSINGNSIYGKRFDMATTSGEILAVQFFTQIDHSVRSVRIVLEKNNVLLIFGPRGTERI